MEKVPVKQAPAPTPATSDGTDLKYVEGKTEIYFGEAECFNQTTGVLAAKKDMNNRGL